MLMQSFPLALILTSIPFMVSMGITPGPNNVLVASSGVNFAEARGESTGTHDEPKPLTFLQAAAFQWVNGKAWVIALGAVTTYTVVDQTLPLQIVALTAISVIITLASVSCWTLFGAFMRQFLHTEKRRRSFNYTMAALLVLSILPVLWE